MDDLSSWLAAIVSQRAHRRVIVSVFGSPKWQFKIDRS
jgi:hypothetical protein